MTRINRNNLPVLYTIPRWQLEFKLGFRNVKYYIPWTNSYIGQFYLRKELSKIGKTVEDWYVRWILNLTTESDIPKCKIPGCDSKVRFCGINVGYKNETCDNPDHRKLGKVMSHTGKSHSESTKIKMSESAKKSSEKDPTLIHRRTESLKLTLSTEAMKTKKSQNMINRYKDPLEHEKTSKGIKSAYLNPESRLNVSKAKLRSWSNPSEAMLSNLNSYGTKSSAYSKWQDKIIYFDSSWEDEFFHKCESNSLVISLLRESVPIRYFKPDNKSTIPNSYRPDFLLNDHYLIEIKPNYLIHDPVNQAKFHAASIYCYDHNLSYVIITEDYLFSHGSPYYGSLPFKLNDHATTD